MAAVIGDLIPGTTRFNHGAIASPSPSSTLHPNRPQSPPDRQQRQGFHDHRDSHRRAASPAAFYSPPHSTPRRPATSTPTTTSASTSTSASTTPLAPTSTGTTVHTSNTDVSVNARANANANANANNTNAKAQPWPRASTSSAAALAAPVHLAGHTQPAAAANLAHNGASRFPSPPSTSPTVAHDDAKGASMASQTPRDDVSSSLAGHALSSAVPPARASSTNASGTLTQGQQQPSPPSEDYRTSAIVDGTDTPQLVPHVPHTEVQDDLVSTSPTQTVIHIRDLDHVQTLARAEVRAGLGAGTLNDPPLQQMKYEISAMPIGDIIEMVAALLTKITTTNDLQHDAMQRNVTHQQQASQSSEAAGSSSSLSSLSHSVLAFHGKNVPAITILSYLSRIHRYCPTTYEVFLSLLVYFDRMTERVNERVTKSEEARRSSAPPRTSSGQNISAQPTSHGASSVSNPAAQEPASQDTPMRDDGESDESDETDSDLADDDDDDDMEDSEGSNRFEVGGLPLAELNHLELQFLVLNDFRLAVPVEDLEAYATMLVEFYAREVVGRAPLPASDD
ncbi:hypothetical protein S7711_08369 [Stachybotrys chartarum IBT 7711]|uniref:Uncharacterized protein n=1 Tax=Stachybotrys chartarum (strain CBS 109288 / IBT 7711) TaxID=1280523 RepID=A0A084AT89_STACB|nr:hypothetical protein S7711_08369 [Stachybotrys chartarum IBT 7711]KFA49944.1 hypothetical protein S40293_01196 [Stachybotrys chartarum IBT 40293]